MRAGIQAVLLLAVFTATSLAAAQPDTVATFPLSAGDMLQVLTTFAKSVEKVGAARNTADVRLWDPDKILSDGVKATLVVEAVSERSSRFRILKGKPKANAAFLAEIADRLREAKRFAGVGRSSTVSREEVAEIVKVVNAVSRTYAPPPFGRYEVDMRLLGKWTMNFGHILTPMMRIAILAEAAKKNYKTLDQSTITPDVLEPSVYIVAEPHDAGDFMPSVARFTSVKHVVLTPNGSKDVTQAIQPSWIKADTSSLQNAYGAVIKVDGMIAAFPTSEMRAGREIVLIYEDGTERRAEITPGKLLTWGLLELP